MSSPEKICGGAQAQSASTGPSPKFTPGPWTQFLTTSAIDGARKVDIIPAGRAGTIALVPIDSKEDDANAHLIAASPDLYEACAEFVRKVEAGEARSTRSYQQMKAALLKAQGGE